MKNLFKLLLFYLFKKTIKIELHDTIAPYRISEIQVFSRINNPEKIIITLTDENPLFPKEYLMENKTQ